jgi:hypothetical protein
MQCSGWLFACSALVFAPALKAQLVVHLSPETLKEFDRYAHTVETDLQARWNGQKPFLALDENAAEKQRVLAGEVYIQPMHGGQPVPIQEGLIHDWLGAIFIPRKSPEQVVKMLEDFDHHKDVYPAVAESHLIQRNGHQVTGYWQLRQKNVVPVILDVVEEAAYDQVAPGKWKGSARSREITETDTGLFSRGRKFPPGEGHGYLWRLYSYWTLASVQGGTLAECRTLSLSREIPPGLAWAVAPYVQKAPQESLTSTLKSTRAALEK